MLSEEHFEKMKAAVLTGDKETISKTSYDIRMDLNPHPAGQLEMNMPRLKDGTILHGLQHKYDQTVLFFQAKAKHVMRIAVFVFDGRNLLESMN